MELEGAGDLRIFLKGNDEHEHLYVDDRDGPKRRAQKETWSCNHGVVCGRNGRDMDNMVQEGRKGAALEGHFTRLPMTGEILTVVKHSLQPDIHQTLVSQCPDIALFEVHRAPSKCENIHEDHDKYTAVMPIATPLPITVAHIQILVLIIPLQKHPQITIPL
ncbi:hypothetical protein Cgig2_022520 [Carnegiea gigantea]|uniref:Uncharacterized protein n=1 Tax=Carnegiea gigantea TaxID=171969 RepID=A0A9Q1JG64_9CARY|nr:hypothetical protein Cgig2_022520 [Carnegiea gigantea]